MTRTVDFKFGTLIRTGPKLINGGKWNAELIEWNRNATTNAVLDIAIQVYFQKIDPATGTSGQYPDTDNRQRRIVAWKPGEFDRFAANALGGAQRFWSGIFWLRTPSSYRGLDWPDAKATHRCNVFCKLSLTRAYAAANAHYTIAVVRVPDTEQFRSNSRLYSQLDIQSKQMISGSTTKFFTHFHEVGHLLGLGHVGWHGHRNLHANNDPRAYGVTMRDMHDVMGRGTAVHPWHATPWREAVATFTDTDKDDWKVSLHRHIRPERIA